MHVCLISQSGAEVADIAEKRGIWPDRIVSSHNDTTKIDSRIQARPEWTPLHSLNKITADTYDKILEGSNLVTLHGWLKIVPASICSKYKIYNGHPGLIIPGFYANTLKGRDPQIRTWANIDKYPFIGSVVHEVIPEVDAGKIITYAYTTHNCRCLQDVFNTCRRMSLQAWLDFFEEPR